MKKRAACFRPLRTSHADVSRLRRLLDAEQGSVVPGRRFFTLYKRYATRYASLRSFTARVLLIFVYFLSGRAERKKVILLPLRWDITQS